MRLHPLHQQERDFHFGADGRVAETTSSNGVLIFGAIASLDQNSCE